VRSLTFSPDALSLVTADTHVTVWDLATSRPRAKLGGHRDVIRSVAVSHDGQTAFSCSDDQTIVAWDLASNEIKHVFRGHVGPVFHICLSSPGTQLASCGKDGTVRIWDPVGPQGRRTLFDSDGARADAVAVAPDGEQVAIDARTGKQTATLSLWSIAGRTAYRKFDWTAENLDDDFVTRSLAFTPDNKRVSLLSHTGRMHVWNLETGETRSYSIPGSEYVDLAISPDGNLFAAASHHARTTRVFDAETGEALAHVPGQRVVAFSPDGRWLATESSDIKKLFPIELWDVKAARSAFRLPGHKSEITDLAFSPDGKWLASGDLVGQVRIWDLKSRKLRHVLRGHVGTVHCVAFTRGGGSLASSGADGSIRFWDIQTASPLITLRVQPDRCYSLSFSRDGSFMVTATKDPKGHLRVELWQG
jgi:WD40 repeat protein